MAGQKDTPADRLLREGPLEEPGGVLPPEPIVAASHPVPHVRVVGDSVRTKRGGGRARVDLPVDDIVASYKAGLSESELARVHQVSRGTIAERLKEAGAKKGKTEVPERVLPGRQFAGRRPALLASASRVNIGDRKAVQGIRSRRQAWQSEAWDVAEEVPEVNYGINYVANLMSKVQLFPAIQLEPGGAPVPIDSDDAIAEVGAEWAQIAVDTLARLKALQGGQAAILHDMSLNLDVAGELYLHGHTETPDQDWDDPDSGSTDGADFVGDEDWQVRSIDELVVTGDQFALRIGTGAQATVPIPEGDLCLRMWARHPRYSWLATSPMRAILGSCETLLLLEREQRAHAQSHLNAGALIVAQECSFGPVDPTREQSDGESTDDPLDQDIKNWFITAVQQPGSAEAVAPGLFRPPADFAGPNFIRWIDMARPDNQYLDQRIENLVMRIARGLNLNVELITGLAATTFSNAEQIWRSVFEDHIKPRCVLTCDCITAGFLQWQLIEAGIPREVARRIFCWFDPTDVIVQDDQAEAAQNAHKDMLISDSAVRRLLGYSEDDAPTPDEVLLRLMINSPRMDPFLFGQLLAKTGLFPEIRIPGPQSGVLDEHESVSELPAPADGTEPSPGESATPAPVAPVVPAAPPEPVTAAGTPANQWKALGPKLAAIDRDLRARTLGALDRQMAVTLKAAGNKIRSKVQSRSTEAKLLASVADPALYASALGRPMVAAAGLADDTLVGDGFDAVLSDIGGWIDSGYAKGFAVLSALVGVSEAQRIETGLAHQANRDAAITFMRTQLEALAATRLYDPSPTEDTQGEGDATGRVPSGLIRAGLAIAGGMVPLLAGSTGGDGFIGVFGAITDSSGDPVFGVATGPDLASLITAGGGTIDGYVWEYGGSDRPFPPHEDLDGVFAADFDDPAWSNSDGWPSDQCAPGDHDGCQCGATQVWLGPDSSGDVTDG